MNPLLAVDQPQAQQRVSKKALARNNPLDPDYISGSSPFVVKARSLINRLISHSRFKLRLNRSKLGQGVAMLLARLKVYGRHQLSGKIMT